MKTMRSNAKRKEISIMEKRFYRSRDDKKLAGVCAGIAEYFEIDPTLVRLIWVVFTFAGGAGLIAYIIAAIIMPERPAIKPRQDVRENPQDDSVEIVEVDEVDGSESAYEPGQVDGAYSDVTSEDRYSSSERSNRNNFAIGATLIIIGTLFFSRNFFRWHWINFSYIWPAILILIGVAMIMNKRK
jgi:phage shock protein C